jgi:hypothetical protein
MSIRVGNLPPPKAVELMAQRRPCNGDPFERTLDALEGRWYACEATGAQAQMSNATLPRATTAEWQRTSRATGSAAAPILRLISSARADLDTALASGYMSVMAVAASRTSVFGVCIGSRAELGAAIAPSSGAHTVALAAAGMNADDPAAVANAAPRPRPGMAATDASRATPAALVMTVMQGHDGRRSLAVRCPPVLRATALALARQWCGEPDAMRLAAVIVNGEVVSPLEGRS